MSELIYFLRVILAGICGITIGYERKNRAKFAGIKTHCIVACAAALMMIVSKYGFFDLIEQGIYEGIEVKLDPSRVASCIVSGVGFLGAGMIFVHKLTIKGLTTAAGIWATAGIGMAIGSGLYLIGILTALLIVFAQIILHKDTKFLALPRYKLLTVTGVDKKNYQKELSLLLENMCILVDEIGVSYNREKDEYAYTFSIEMPRNLNEDELLEKINYNSTVEPISQLQS